MQQRFYCCYLEGSIDEGGIGGTTVPICMVPFAPAHAAPLANGGASMLSHSTVGSTGSLVDGSSLDHNHTHLPIVETTESAGKAPRYLLSLSSAFLPQHTIAPQPQPQQQQQPEHQQQEQEQEQDTLSHHVQLLAQQVQVLQRSSNASRRADRTLAPRLQELDASATPTPASSASSTSISSSTPAASLQPPPTTRLEQEEDYTLPLSRTQLLLLSRYVAETTTTPRSMELIPLMIS